MRVYRSPFKLFLFGIVGVVLIAAAVDIGFGYWLSEPPDNNDGVLTTRGQAQQRGDIVWGGSMVAVGVLLFGGAVTELVRRKPTIDIGGEGMQIGSGGDEAPGFIPWSEIEAVSSGIAPDPYDGSDREHLVIHLKAGTLVAANLVDVTREQRTLYVDAHDWTMRVTEVALAAQGALDHFVRMEEIGTYEPPSIVWEVTINQPPPTAIQHETPSPDDSGGDDTEQDNP